MWIEPLDYQVGTNDNLTAHIVNGQDFEGVKLPFVPRRFAHFVTFVGDDGAKVQSRIGDSPALDQAPISEGLNVVAYQARNADVTYETWEKFQKFLDHKDLGDLQADHVARGFPLEGFKEVYSRYSKSLIGVGNSVGADKRVGLATEIVALTNPYTDDLSSGMRVQLFYNNATRNNEQIEVFEKAPDGKLNIFTLRTNGSGIATVPVKSGHEYMLDAVVIRWCCDEYRHDTAPLWYAPCPVVSHRARHARRRTCR